MITFKKFSNIGINFWPITFDPFVGKTIKECTTIVKY